MSTITAFKAGQAGGSDRLTDMLTAPDERMRCLGRAFASRIGETLEEWLRAEHERGTEDIVLLEVVATLGVQHVASVAAHCVAPTGDAAVVNLLVGITTDKLPQYMDAVRASRKGGAA